VTLRFEPDETFFVNLSNPVNASIAAGQGVGTIQNDDTNVSVAVSPASVTEDSGTGMVYTFTRNARHERSVDGELLSGRHGDIRRRER